MTTRLLALAATSLLALAACGSDDSSSDDAPDTAEAAAEEPAPDSEAVAPADDAVITIADFAFGDPITVAPGTEVTVNNVDGAPHSVTSSEAGFTSGILDPDTSGSFIAPDSPGTYAFVCAVHPSMAGELIVS